MTRPATPPAPRKHSNAMIALNLVLIALVAAAAYVRLGPGGPMLQHYVAMMEGHGDEGAGAAAAAPFDPAALAGNPGAWPASVMLKEPAAFPAASNAQGVSAVNLPAGTVVKLVGIKGELLDLEYEGARQKLPWSLTDLEERVRENAAGGAHD